MRVQLFSYEQKPLNFRKGQRTNQKNRNLVSSDQQMQRLEGTELRKADRTVGVKCYIFANLSSAVRPDFLRKWLPLKKQPR